MNVQLIHLAIAAPLVSALIIALGLPKRFATKLAAVAFAVPALIAVWLWCHFPAAADIPAAQQGYAFYSTMPVGLESLGINLTLGLNGIALPLFVLAGIVGLAAGLYAIQSGAERLKLYLILLLIMQGGLMGVFASIDIFFFYFFHELALIPTFIMIGLWGGRDRNYAAIKMTIYLTVGAMLSLIGLIAVAMKSNADVPFDLISLRQTLAATGLRETTQTYAFGLLMFGFGILVSLWPFHTWAPLGYGEAPSSAAMLHAGVLKKFGLYGLIQIALPLLPAGATVCFTVDLPLLPAFTMSWVGLMSVLALGNILVIGFVTIAQRDLKQMVGYSSVMHMGYAFLGIACFSAVGIGGVVMLMVGHGLSVALLFMLSTSIYHRTHTFDMQQMGGLVKHAPVLSALFVAGTLASLGLPGFANFWGELTIFVALWSFSKTLCALAVAGVVISAIYGLRSAARVFFGQPTEAFAQVIASKQIEDIRWSERLPALILFAALLFIGFWPKSISTPLNSALGALYPAPTAEVAKK